MNELKIGWLSPTGTFVPCEMYDHTSVADNLVMKYNYYHPTFRCSDDILLVFGWVKISQSLRRKKEWYIDWNHFLTEMQKSFLKTYYEDTIPVSLGSKCRWEKEYM